MYSACDFIFKEFLKYCSFMYVYFFFYLGTKTRQKKFIHGLRKTPKLNPNKPKKCLNVGIIQSTITTKKEILPITSANSSCSLSSLVSADYESTSSSD